MNQPLINIINSCKTRSPHYLRNQQTAYIPRIEKDQIEYTVNKYTLDDKIYPVDRDAICIKLSYLRFSHNANYNTIKPFQNRRSSFEYLVSKNLLYPFMLFINDRFIPWKFISVIMDGNNYYLYIDFQTDYDKTFIQLCNTYEFMYTVSLPGYAKYITNENNDSELQPLFSFNKDGFFNIDNPEYLFVPYEELKNILYNTFSSRIGVKAYKLLNSSDVKLSRDNVFLFVDGKLDIANRWEYKVRSGTRETITLEDKTFYIMDLKNRFPDNAIEPSHEIKFDSTLITIDDGQNPDNKNYQFVIFINTNYTESADNISKLSLDYLQNYLIDNSYTEEHINRRQEFSLSMNRNKNYRENVLEAINTIMKYNGSLLNSTIQNNSNISIEEYNGEWIMANTRDDGTIRIPRSHNGTEDEFFIVLHNGELYQYFSNCYYMNNYFIIPIQGVNYDDTFELIRFCDVNNNAIGITVNKDDVFSPIIVNDSAVLFCTETNEPNAYNFPNDGLQHFPVEYSLETDEVTGMVKIVFKDEFYYGKRLKLAYKNRFVHSTFKIGENHPYDEYMIDLRDRFMYCPEYYGYMVFYNGRRLSTDKYRLVLPVKPSTPFYDFKLYTTIPAKAGDRIDVFYVPGLINDVKADIDNQGLITVPKSDINYCLSSNTYMVWANGKKIPKSYITDIDSLSIKLIKDIKSTSDVYIMKYIPDIDSIVEAFVDNPTIHWDDIINNEDMYDMLGLDKSFEVTDTEPPIAGYKFSIKALMNELIRNEFVSNPNVDATRPFIYDYLEIDDSAVDGYDESGNILLSAMDANSENELPIPREVL